MAESSSATGSEREMRNHRIRKYRLVVLIVVLVAVTTLVLVRGVDQQGMVLIGVAAVLTGFRAWQYRVGRRRG